MTLDRWELLRALGAVAADPAAATALGLPPCGTAEHSEVFAFNCPPYASAYLGDITARLAASWTAIGLDVPAEPDHLSTLLGLYARLGEAGAGPLRQALFREHLWPWLPAYLGAVGDLPAGALTQWAALTLDALRRERDPDGPLPLALREAPLALRGGAAGLLDGLTTPLRSGIILTRRAVAAAADQIGAGQRIGDRRRALAPCWPPNRNAPPAGWRTRRTAGRGGTWPWSPRLPPTRFSGGGPTAPRAPPAS